jgi:hypothetical protein
LQSSWQEPLKKPLTNLLPGGTKKTLAGKSAQLIVKFAALKEILHRGTAHPKLEFLPGVYSTSTDLEQGITKVLLKTGKEDKSINTTRQILRMAYLPAARLINLITTFMATIPNTKAMAKVEAVPKLLDMVESSMVVIAPILFFSLPFPLGGG